MGALEYDEPIDDGTYMFPPFAPELGPLYEALPAGGSPSKCLVDPIYSDGAL